ASATDLGPSTGDHASERITWTRQSVSLGAPSAASDGLGGWTLSPHHVYDPAGAGAVYLGDGRVMFGDEMPPTVHQLSMPSSSAGSSRPYNNISLAPGDTLYATDDALGEIVKVSPSGTVTVVAGTGTVNNYGGDGIATTKTLPGHFTGLARGSDGAIYFSCN